jgi:hypothetical protein
VVKGSQGGDGGRHSVGSQPGRNRRRRDELAAARQQSEQDDLNESAVHRAQPLSAEIRGEPPSGNTKGRGIYTYEILVSIAQRRKWGGVGVVKGRKGGNGGRHPVESQPGRNKSRRDEPAVASQPRRNKRWRDELATPRQQSEQDDFNESAVHGAQPLSAEIRGGGAPSGSTQGRGIDTYEILISIAQSRKWGGGGGEGEEGGERGETPRREPARKKQT